MLYRTILNHHQFKSLGAFYLHSTVRLFAVSIFQIFSGIYVYQVFVSFGFTNSQSLALSSLFFALMYLVMMICIVPALWLISKKGLRFSVFLGSISLIACFMVLSLAKYDPFFLIPAAILSGMQLAFYWIGYHIYFTKLTDDKSQGEEISIGSSLAAVAAIGGPAFGGLIISYFGYSTVFLVMTVLMILAVVPLKYIPSQKGLVEINIVKTVIALSPKKESMSLLSLMGAGAVQVTSLIYWPVYVLPVLGTIVGVGFLGSIVALFASLSTLVTGFVIDKFGAKHIINIVSPLEAIASVLKAFVFLPMHAFLVSIFSGIFSEAQYISLDSLIYQRARHVDIVAFIVQREFGLNIGRFIFLSILGILFWFELPLMMVFVIAAFLALAARLYPYMGTSDN